MVVFDYLELFGIQLNLLYVGSTQFELLFEWPAVLSQAASYLFSDESLLAEKLVDARVVLHVQIFQAFHVVEHRRIKRLQLVAMDPNALQLHVELQEVLVECGEVIVAQRQVFQVQQS